MSRIGYWFYDKFDYRVEVTLGNFLLILFIVLSAGVIFGRLVESVALGNLLIFKGGV